ncbi:MAG: aspartate kinase [Bacteroidota bacterium]|nr:aspartate kinase [Bacteroidota bacterium]MDP4214725.1 aspartate kinase [Bacteroidota bacterium]MDP4257686.1 aspartate kinase [Bacteroidota bacterium]
MKIFKFGGASVNSVERIQRLAEILRGTAGSAENVLVVISAMGKTTNALEKVVEAFYAGHRDEALRLFEQVKQSHLTTAKYLLVKNYLDAEAHLRDHFTEVEWLLHDKPVREFDYYYDQVVCIGELLSTCIISAYLAEMGIGNQWIDVRDIFRTDNNFRDAAIDWAYTAEQTRRQVLPLFDTDNMVITQGFIGATAENESTTLGREGSDYSAAVFANLLDAESQTIWKDVEGVMNADPKLFPDARVISELSYDEVIEMAYYGAQVIHPKTIKPLQNKGIPLYVKCFLDSSLPGTVIFSKSVKGLPPIIVLKRDQALVYLHSKDFSFVGEELTGKLYHLFSEIRIKPNLMQSGAVTIQVCLDDRAEKIEKLALSAAEYFDVQIEKGLTLLTIRHYQEEILRKMTEGRQMLLRQQGPETVQVLMR